MEHRTLLFYRDELRDEFARDHITPRRIDGDWRYLRSPLAHFFWYRIIATPFALFYTKLVHGHTVVGREKLAQADAAGGPLGGPLGYFLYGNHTQQTGDAFLPHMLNLKKEHYTVVHANNVSMAGLSHITPYLGALPLPDNLAAHRNFRAAIDTCIARGDAVVIYPEAHIWPYYTGIRPFPDTAFEYPVRLGAPVFAFTNTYQKRRFTKRPRIVTYIDGPFTPDASLPRRLAQQALRDQVYEAMLSRAKNSTVARIHYIKIAPAARREEEQA